MTTEEDQGSTAPEILQTAPPEIPEAVLRAVWESSADGLAITDSRGAYCYVSPAYSAMLGHPAGELVGRTFLELVPPEYRALYIGFYKTVIETRGSGESGEFPIRRADGQLITLLVRHSRLTTPAGDLHFFVNRDITERKAVEQDRQHIDRMRTLGALAGGVAHEFNNLLVAILGYAELIQTSKGLTLEMLLEFARKIQRVARRGRELTAQLLPFARPEARQTRAVDLHQVIREAADLFLLSSPGVPLRLVLQAEPALILGDSVQLHQVFFNLFLSATTALADAGQPIVLETGLVQESLRWGEPVTPYDFVLIEVSPLPVRARPSVPGQDSDPSIPPDAFDQTGLSLALVQGSIASHGGWLAAEPGRLRIWLPALTRPES